MKPWHFEKIADPCCCCIYLLSVDNPDVPARCLYHEFDFEESVYLYRCDNFCERNGEAK
jgi:hypothetical protein